MPLINYESPDYQRMVQRTMASPLARTNPTMQRKLMATYTGNVMKQRTALEGAVQQKMRQKQQSEYANSMMGISERETGLKKNAMDIRAAGQQEQFRGNQINESYRMGDLSLRQGEMKDKEQDLNSQALWGLLPMAFSAYEGNRRAKITENETADRKLWQDQMLFATNNPNYKEPTKPQENKNLRLLNWE